MLDVGTKTGVDVRLAESPVIADTLEDFAAYLAAKKVRDRTVDTYVREVRRFSQRLGAESTIAEITSESIDQHQHKRRKLSAATLGKTLSVPTAAISSVRASAPTIRRSIWRFRSEGSDCRDRSKKSSCASSKRSLRWNRRSWMCGCVGSGYATGGS